jgi:hypothetical protein
MKKPALGGAGSRYGIEARHPNLPAAPAKRKHYRLTGPVWIEAVARRHRYRVPVWRTSTRCAP